MLSPVVKQVFPQQGAHKLRLNLIGDDKALCFGGALFFLIISFPNMGSFMVK